MAVWISLELTPYEEQQEEGEMMEIAIGQTAGPTLTLRWVDRDFRGLRLWSPIGVLEVDGDRVADVSTLRDLLAHWDARDWDMDLVRSELE